MSTPNLRRLLRGVWSRRRHLLSYARGVLRGHPGARIGRGVRLSGPGRYRIERGATLTTGVRIWVGDGATFTLREGAKLGDRTIVNAATSVTIERGTRVSWDVQIMDTDFHWIENADGTRRPHKAAIVLGPRALIGARSMVLKGVIVGEGAVVGAGSIVRRSVAPGVIVSGNPAREVGQVTDWGSAPA